MIQELTIEASYQCNLNCLFCSSRNSIFNIKKSDLLQPDQIGQAIAEFQPQIIRWSGGEPFLYLNDEYLQTAAALSQIVTTNGMLPEKIIKLADYFAEIRVSVLGNQVTHDKLTRVPGSWAKAMQTVKYLNEKISANTKLLLTAPFVSDKQVKQVKTIAQELNLETRIAGLVPGKLIPRPHNNMPSQICSLGGDHCHFADKRLILPNGKIIHCAVEKTGYICPFLK